MTTARLDEQSLSPSSRLVMCLLMLIGGSLGGTAGGLRLLVAWLLVRSLRARRANQTPALLLRAALRVVAALTLLVVTVSLLLIYRDVGSFEASLFESISACCNAGASMGLTRQLAVESRILLMLAMIAGRVLPMAILFEALRGRGVDAAQGAATSIGSLPTTPENMSAGGSSADPVARSDSFRF